MVEEADEGLEMFLCTCSLPQNTRVLIQTQLTHSAGKNTYIKVHGIFLSHTYIKNDFKMKLCYKLLLKQHCVVGL